MRHPLAIAILGMLSACGGAGPRAQAPAQTTVDAEVTEAGDAKLAESQLPR